MKRVRERAAVEKAGIVGVGLGADVFPSLARGAVVVAVGVGRRAAWGWLGWTAWTAIG